MRLKEVEPTAMRGLGVMGVYRVGLALFEK